jgi:hypothetical protein
MSLTITKGDLSTGNKAFFVIEPLTEALVVTVLDTPECSNTRISGLGLDTWESGFDTRISGLGFDTRISGLGFDTFLDVLTPVELVPIYVYIYVYLYIYIYVNLYTLFIVIHIRIYTYLRAIGGYPIIIYVF